MAKAKLPKVYFRTIGKLGGKRKSAKKTAATRRNMEKARLARWAAKPARLKVEFCKVRVPK